MNQKAITVYLDQNQNNATELSWLYKTWILHKLDSEFDLVVYYHPKAGEVLEKLKDRPQLVSIEMEPLANTQHYKFLNSRNIFLAPYNEHLKTYEYLLVTDCDVFLTQYIGAIVPEKIHIGWGAYCQKEDPHHIACMDSVCRHFSFQHQGIINVGSSFYGKANLITEIVRKQIEFSHFFLSSASDALFWKPYNRNAKAVASLLGGELAINMLCKKEEILKDVLDSKCSNRNYDESTLHIHAWHTLPFWSKHQFFHGRYRNLKINFVDAFENTAGYCHWIATTPIEEIKRIRRLIDRLV